MRRATSALSHGLIAAVLIGAVAVGVGERSKVEAQGRTMPLLMNEQGVFSLVANVMGTNRTVGGSLAHISGFPQATDSYSGVQYPRAANGCAAYTNVGTVTFTGAKESYDWAGVGTVCPVAGDPVHFTGTGTFVVTQGHGLLKGASGGGRYKAVFTLLPPKAGQPATIQYTQTGTSGTVTLPS